MPQVIKFDGHYQLPAQVLDQANDKRFDHIFTNGIWGRSTGGESMSGSGSTMAYTELYRQQLSLFFSEYCKGNFTFFDAPCGDLNWITSSFRENMRYIGGDISSELIRANQQKHPEIELFQFDIATDDFPQADIWHCRHCLFHLSLADIAMALENYTNSNINVALITNHFLPDAVTLDIPTGSFRNLDLTNYPFYLPNPKLWLLDYNPVSGKNALATGVWTKDEILHGVNNYKRLWSQRAQT